jgi:hypothetical protein
MRGCEKLAEIGRKEIRELRRLHRQTDVKFKALLKAQRLTKAGLRAFLDSIPRGGNGHGSRSG